MITGDTIFHPIRRTPRSWRAGQGLVRRLCLDTLQYLKTYPDNILVLPGHYMDWSEANTDLNFCATLGGDQRVQTRPFMQLSNKKEFLAFIEGNMRKQPDEYATIRKINANFEQAEDDKG